MPKLICFDIDGIIFKDINFWMELHKQFGTYAPGVELTKKYLKSDYDRLVEEVVVKLWKGKDAQLYFKLINSLEYLPGVKETFAFLHQKKYLIALISASSIEVARRVQRELGADYLFANELVIKDNKISGEFIWPIGAGYENKAEIIRSLSEGLNILLKDIVYVGDSETDLEAFKIVGLSIAFNSTSDKLKAAADKVIERVDLREIISMI